MRCAVGHFHVIRLGLCPSRFYRAGASGADWLVRAEQNIAEREYRASENDRGLQAPNRAHNLRTYFDANGVRVHDRVAAGSPELLRLSLRAPKKRTLRD